MSKHLSYFVKFSNPKDSYETPIIGPFIHKLKLKYWNLLAADDSCLAQMSTDFKWSLSRELINKFNLDFDHISDRNVFTDISLWAE